MCQGELYMFYDNVLKLCEARGVKITNVITELGFSQGNLSNWKNGRVPRADSIKKLADYFGVPVDALIYGDGAASNPSPAIIAGVSDTKRELIELILSLPDEKVKRLHQIAQVALDL